MALVEGWAEMLGRTTQVGTGKPVAPGTALRKGCGVGQEVGH